MRVDLSKGEMYVCRNIGFMRRCANLNKTKDQQMGKQDPWDIDMDGVIGEFCVAKILNLCPDFEIKPRSGSPDLILKDGRSADVKTTRLINGNLVATMGKNESRSDVYILAIVDHDGCTITGWIDGETFLRDENIKNLGHGDTYFYDRTKLNTEIMELF